MIVGGGIAGLSAAIRLKQLNTHYRVCLLEKGSEVGSHIISGAVFEPKALDELLPEWQTLGLPIDTLVSNDQFFWLTKTRAYQIPKWMLPKELNNQGNYIISLANLCRWLAEYAEMLGVEVFAGFSGAELLFNERRLVGVATGDMGVAKDGKHKTNYTQGVEIYAQYTVLAEGCRGSLTEQIIGMYKLRARCDPQTYGLGIKEVWEVSSKKHSLGLVTHAVGWPLDHQTYGGSFIYHLPGNRVSMGLIIGLDYQNPFLDPFAEMQRFKLHPIVRELIKGGKRLSFGARALNEGGLQALPKLTFPGGVIVGCGLGFLNIAKLKGSHTAMKSAMLAAEAIDHALRQPNEAFEAIRYTKLFAQSWLYKELYRTRNFRYYFKKHGLTLGAIYAGLDLKLFRGKVPWTLHNDKEDRNCMKKKSASKPIHYPEPDNQLTFDRASSISLANISHRDDQPIHLSIIKTHIALEQTFPEYAGPEQRYCPAQVYEYVESQQSGLSLKINAQNCIHCKTCDIKDPLNNIRWILPEGGSGPHYIDM